MGEADSLSEWKACPHLHTVAVYKSDGEGTQVLYISQRSQAASLSALPYTDHMGEVDSLSEKKTSLLHIQLQSTDRLGKGDSLSRWKASLLLIQLQYASHMEKADSISEWKASLLPTQPCFQVEVRRVTMATLFSFHLEYGGPLSLYYTSPIYHT